MKQAVLKIIYKVLAKLAKKVIDRHKPFVVGITGSVGKTSTKEAVYQVLADHFGEREVRKNYGNLNAEIGVPLTVLGFEKLPNKFLWLPFLFLAYLKSMDNKYPKYLILEMGVEHPGDIEYYSNIAKPNIGVITWLEPVHMVNFQNIAEFEKEKLAMIKAVPEVGKIIINIDDKRLSKREEHNLITIGVKNKSANYRAENIEITEDGTQFSIVAAGQKIVIKSGLVGTQSIYALLIAYAIGREFGIQSLKIKNSLEKIQPIPGRMNLIEGKRKVLIIDDTYNANLASMRAALDVLEEIRIRGRKVAILGNMNELGSLEREAHKSLGEYARDKTEFAVFIGSNSKIVYDAFADKDRSLAFRDRAELILNISSIVKEGDIVLVKASQNGNYLEEVVKKLMKNPEKASKLLVRQTNYWLKKK